VSLHPAENAGRRSASSFRFALADQLGQTVAYAADLAAVAQEEGWGSDGDGHVGHSPGRSVLDHSGVRHASLGNGRVRRGDIDAPDYRGGKTSENADSWMKFAMAEREKGGLGLTREQASGIVGNLEHESGSAIAPSGVTGDHGTAHGAAQWRGERFSRLQQKAGEWGLDWKSTQAQQRFMRWELDNTESGANTALRAAKTPEQAADAFNRNYERSADPGGGRRAAARRIFEQRGEADASDPAGNVGDVGDLKSSPGRHPDLEHVDPRLREIMAAAATHLPPGYTMGINEGYNPHGHAPGSQHHSRSGALDVQIFDPQGHPISNRGADTTGMYTQLGRAAYGEMQARHPELEGRLAHGASFGTSRGSGVPDLMHFDLGGERGDLAPHLSKLGPLPNQQYGVARSAPAAPEQTVTQDTANHE
jgi:hypothetical protein